MQFLYNDSKNNPPPAARDAPFAQGGQKCWVLTRGHLLQTVGSFHVYISFYRKYTCTHAKLQSTFRMFCAILLCGKFRLNFKQRKDRCYANAAYCAE